MTWTESHSGLFYVGWNEAEEEWGTVPREPRSWTGERGQGQSRKE